MAKVTKIKSGNILYDICPSPEAVYIDTSYDTSSPSEFLSVDVLNGDETISNIYQKTSKMFSNIRFLKTSLDGKVSKSGGTITGNLTIGNATIYSDGRIVVGGTTINADGSINVGGTTIATTGAITTNQNITINSNGSITIGNTTINSDGSIVINNNTSIDSTGKLTVGSTTIAADGTLTAGAITMVTNHYTSNSDKIVVFNSSDGKYYYRTTQEILSDIGAGGSSTVSGTTLIVP